MPMKESLRFGSNQQKKKENRNTFKSKPKRINERTNVCFISYFDNRIIKTIASTEILLYDAKSVWRNAFGMKPQIMSSIYRSKQLLYCVYSAYKRLSLFVCLFVSRSVCVLPLEAVGVLDRCTLTHILHEISVTCYVPAIHSSCIRVSLYMVWSSHVTERTHNFMNSRC